MTIVLKYKSYEEKTNVMLKSPKRMIIDKLLK
jgi:hypothetical protein